MFNSYLGTEELGAEQSPLARDGQIDPHALGGAAAAEHRPLSGQPLRQLSGGEHTKRAGKQGGTV